MTALSARVDAHHHVWSLARGDYGWLTPQLAPIHRDFTLEDLLPELHTAGIGATVLVQAAPTVAETHFLLDVARNSDGLVRGVVGWIDLAADDAVETLGTLARDPLLKSIRPMLHDLDDADWIARPGVAKALQAMAGRGLRMDALVRSRELPALLRVLEQIPTLPVVIDHGAKPDIASRSWQPWADRIAAVASHQQTYCKLSGLVTEAGGGWATEDLQCYVDHLFACFGARRMMWGSDWPVVNLAGGYAKWRSATDVLLASLAPTERALVLGENALAFYGLQR